MSLKKLMSILCMLAISLLIFAACESDDPPDPPVEETDINVLPVGTLYAGQTGNNEITIEWAASPSKDSTWFEGYELMMSDLVVATVGKEQFQHSFGSLDASSSYTFKVVALGKNVDTIVRSTAKEVQWALATHFTLNENSAPIFVYTRESADYGSGLQLFGPADAPRIRRVSNGADWNIAVGSKDNLRIGSALAARDSVPFNLTGTPTHNSEITAPINFDTDALNSLLLDRDLSQLSYTNRLINLATDPIAQNANKGIVFFARTNNHYAKIVVLKNGDGGGYLHAANSNNPYVHFLVSYQTRQGVPFAKPTN